MVGILCCFEGFFIDFVLMLFVLSVVVCYGLGCICGSCCLCVVFRC